MTMKSALVGENKWLGSGEIPIPKPGADQVLVKVHSCPINVSDVIFMSGNWGVPTVFPFTPGWEGSGEVTEAGSGDHAKSLVGKRVAFKKAGEKTFPWTIGGAFAEYAIADIKSVVPLPDDMTFEEGASSFVNPMTALGLIQRMKEIKAKAIIISAAASQLGRMLIKLCDKEGLVPICTVRRAE
jgi:NADPH:quinone reductase-like Zn-dependent oxidoreductase